MSSKVWSTRKLEECSEIIFSGGTPATKNPNYWGGSIKWLSSGETRNDFIYDTERKITLEGVRNSSTKLAKVNDVVIASAGQGNTRGQASLCKVETYINQSIIAIRANQKILCPVFLYYNIKNRYSELRKISDGSSIRGSLTIKDFKKLLISVPDISEQNLIGTILASLDEKIEVNNKINNTLERMAQEIFKRWFVDFEFPNEDGVPYKSSGGEMFESELGLIPKGWGVESINDLTTLIIDHRGKTPKKLGADWSQEGIIALSAKSIKNRRLVNIDKANFVSKELYEIWMKEELEYGDILLTSEAPLGEIYFLASNEKYCLSQRLFALRANKNKISPEILFMYLQTEKIMDNLLNRATGTTVTGIRQSELRKVKIIKPSHKIQNQIHNVLYYLLKRVNLVEKENMRLDEIRDVLLPKLMSGEIRVPMEES